MAKNGTVWAGTDAGLAHSDDGGQTWRFLRGADWADKAAGTVSAGAAVLGLVDNADLRGLEILPLGNAAEKPIRIAAGGPAADGWDADRDFVGGNIFHANDPVDARAVPFPAPQAVYQNARWGSFACRIPGLRPGAAYRVRLHLAEVAWDQPGRRVFNVAINGQAALSHFDIFAAAGGKNKAIVREFTTLADAQGQIALDFRGAAPPPFETSSRALLEDYVLSLAEDPAGRLWIGHRERGVEVLDTSGARVFPPPSPGPAPSDFLSALLPFSDGMTLIAGHGGGLMTVRLPAPLPAAPPTAPVPMTADSVVPSLPAPDKPPEMAALNAMLKQISAVPSVPPDRQPLVVALDDDWITRGDWLGRHGRYWACLPALFHPLPIDYLWGAGEEPVEYDLTNGPNHDPGDRLRYWLNARYTTEPHCLEMPAPYLHSRVLKGYTTWDKNRRDSSVDDHGETYPRSLDGPHVYATVSVPDGLFILSLYLFIRQDNLTSERDFRLSVRSHAGQSLEDISGFEQQPELAHGRVLQNFGGVYKRFLVRGPATVTAQVNRNNSWNTELDGIFLDCVDEAPPPYFQTVPQWEQKEAQHAKTQQTLLAETPVAHAQRFRPGAFEADAANRLFEALENLRLTNAAWQAVNSRPFYAALRRWYDAQSRTAGKPSPRLAARLGTCCYQLNLYPQWEDHQAQQGLTTARQIETRLRWDGATDSYSGLGYDIVTASLTEQAGHKQGKVFP